MHLNINRYTFTHMYKCLYTRFVTPGVMFESDMTLRRKVYMIYCKPCDSRPFIVSLIYTFNLKLGEDQDQ